MDRVFDVGHTETVVGCFRGAELASHWRLTTDARRTPDEYGLLLRQLLAADGVEPREVRSATIGSVVPALTSILRGACSRLLHVEAATVDARTSLPIRLDVEEPLTVGADRIVNTLAALRLYHSDVIVVDLGTATTYDCITADGVFVGGVIAPGVKTAAERLTERTAKLPRVDLVAPERVIGRRTETCLQSGIFYGAVDAIDGMVRRIRAEWGKPDALAVATGGLAQMLAPHSETITRVDPFLTLHGLRFAREHMDLHPA
ncbi:MAG TPA: type III pantothenate kinase [Longimicrobiaceae bacterium]|nr:type III pantothenate kinase [Longimicrobiaceae bacterium]